MSALDTGEHKIEKIVIQLQKEAPKLKELNVVCINFYATEWIAFSKSVITKTLEYNWFLSSSPDHRLIYYFLLYTIYHTYLNYFYVRLDDSCSCFQELKVLKNIFSWNHLERYKHDNIHVIYNTMYHVIRPINN